MNKITLILFLFITTNLVAQIQSGTIIYGVKVNKKEMKKIVENNDQSDEVEAYMLNFLRDLQKSITYIEFTLKFNRSSSHFKGKETMENDNGINLNKAYGAVSGDGIFYTNKVITIWQRDYQNKQYKIKMPSDFNWDITKESKTIKGYTCFKATSKQIIDKKPVTTTAWFCPELNFQFGPKEFHGLPGLILELNYLNRFKFYAKNITLVEKNKKIEKPSQGKIITKEDFDKVLSQHRGYYKN